MGWEVRRVTVDVTCHVSRHNSARDDEDDALVDELARRVSDAVKPIVEDARYRDVILDVTGLETSG